MSDISKKMKSIEIADRVKSLMENNGVTRRHQAKELSHILGLTYSAATRKMKGCFPWSMEQIESIASAYGEHPSALVLTPDESDSSISGIESDATLIIEGQNVQCSAWIGGELNIRHLPTFVATGKPGNWRVYLGAQAPFEKLFHVELIEIRQTMAKPRIAILDDHEDTADSLCDYFNDHGFEATAYYHADTFRRAFTKNRFDAYIVDWLLGNETAETNIASIRRRGNTPIFLLTGELVTGKVDESDIARVINEFNATHFEKPVRPSLLLAELSKALKFITQSNNSIPK
jgi:CheY-like chemotaxis protein